jgi:formate dehydrogenase formation protein
MKLRRGGPGDFAGRLARTDSVSVASAAGPLRLLAAVLDHQQKRAAVLEEASAGLARTAGRRRDDGVYPLLDLDSAAALVAAEIPAAVAAVAVTGGALPVPLGEIGQDLAGGDEGQRLEVVDGWLGDDPLTDARAAFWVRVAAGPLLEPAAAAVASPSREVWTGRVCPVCGGRPQVSVIAPETGEFMAGSPRSLVCGRCASWWVFARATCPWCEEDDPRRLIPYVPDGRRFVRIDACETCRSYIKTFDLREQGAADIVPLVDDVATLALDVWAHQQGLHRQVVSLAGV